MKKTFLKLLMLALMTLLPQLVNAYDFCVEGIYYNVISEDDMTCGVTCDDRTKYKGDVIIPSEVEYYGKTYRVTTIFQHAFFYTKDVTSVVIPSSITTLESHAFYSCPGTLFLNCNLNHEYTVNTPFHISFSTVVFGDNVTEIGEYAFSNSSLEELVIPNTVTSIGDQAFADCSQLINVTIPSTVKKLGKQIFYRSGTGTLSIDLDLPDYDNSSYSPFCGANFSTIHIGNNVTSLGDYAFYDCQNVTNIDFPNSITHIGDNVFTLAKPTSPVYNSVIFAKMPKEYSGEYIIPDGIKEISSFAFSGCSNITSVKIPATVTAIGESAFYNCTSLQSVNIPDGVESVGPNAFYNCYKIKDPLFSSTVFINMPTSFTGEYEIPEGIKEISEVAFSNCRSLTSVKIPRSVNIIGQKAFYFCDNLSSVSIGEGITEIGDFAFYYCSKLSSFTLPESVNKVGVSAFLGCSGINNIISNSTVFAYMSKKYSGDYVMPEGITSIAGNAFNGCANLTSVTLPNSLHEIANGAFNYCSGIKEIKFGNNVTRIGDNAFYYCQNLTSVVLPETLETIGNSAFGNCVSLQTINIPNSLSFVGEGVFSNTINTPLLNSKLFIYLPRDYEGEYNIPNGIREISDNAFSGCKKLTAVNIPTTVSEIGVYSFSGCTSLTSLTLPGSLTNIGRNCFINSTSLLDIYCLAKEVPTVHNYAFSNFDTKSCTLHVPEESLSDYKSTSPWNQFGSYATIKICAKPVIKIIDGKISAHCETENSVCHIKVVPVDFTIEETSKEIVIPSSSYVISCYATAEGYEQSVLVTETITKNAADVNGDGRVTMADANAIVNIVLGK